MNDEQRADRLFQTWLESEVPTAVPEELLDRIDIATRSARPRPAWIARLEGHHMELLRGRRSGVPKLSLVFVIIALALAAAAMVAFVASQQPSIVVLPDPSATPTAKTFPETTLDPSHEPSIEPTPARIVSAGLLIEGRAQHVATLLADGRVLISGGTGAHEPHAGTYLTSTEIWDPLTNTTTASGSVDPAVDHLLRTTQDAFLLPDGRVLMVPGGCFCRPMPTAPAEVWDPSTRTWRAIDALTITRTGHSSTLLADGRVLIAGAGSPPFDGGPAAADAFIWDPVRVTSTPTGSMATGRGYHTATRLADGRVLVIGGSSGGPEDLVRSAETWDPATGSFSVVPSLANVLGIPVTIGDGRVLIVGDAAATLWDPRDDSVSDGGSLIHERSGGHTVTLLADGRVLIVGSAFLGADRLGEAILEVELWDPETLAFEVAGTLSGLRAEHTTTALPDGRAVIVGGLFGAFGGAPLQLIERWEPAGG